MRMVLKVMHLQVGSSTILTRANSQSDDEEAKEDVFDLNILLDDESKFRIHQSEKLLKGVDDMLTFLLDSLY